MAVNEQYFVLNGGILSLKPEYRGGYSGYKNLLPPEVRSNLNEVPGEKYGELPIDLIVPDSIGGVSVASLAVGIFGFCINQTSITLPSGITSIPSYFATGSFSLRHISNTSGIQSIGDSAFRISGLVRAEFINVNLIGANCFSQCPRLFEVVVPKITAAPNGMCNNCNRLVRVVANSMVEVGNTAFNKTRSLKEIVHTQKFTEVGKGAFLGSALNVENDIDENTVIGTLSVYTNYSSGFSFDDFWSAFWEYVGDPVNNKNGASYRKSRIENKLQSTFSQADKRTVDLDYAPVVNNTMSRFLDSCVLQSISNIYCAVHPYVNRSCILDLLVKKEDSGGNFEGYSFCERTIPSQDKGMISFEVFASNLGLLDHFISVSSDSKPSDFEQQDFYKHYFKKISGLYVQASSNDWGSFIEDKASWDNPDVIYVFDNRYVQIATPLSGTGDGSMSSGKDTGEFESVQNMVFMIYYTILRGGYVQLSIPSSSNTRSHVAVAYGFEENGDLLILDSSDSLNVIQTKNSGNRYTMPIRKLTVLNRDAKVSSKIPNKYDVVCFIGGDVVFPSEPFSFSSSTL